MIGIPKSDGFKVTNVEQLNNLLLNEGVRTLAQDVLSPNMARLWQSFRVGSNLAQQGHSVEAIHSHRNLLDEWPAFVPARIGLAEELAELGNYQDAIRELDIAHTFAPSSSKLHMVTARLFDIMGDHKNELQQSLLATQDNPNEYDAMINIGLTYMENYGENGLALEWLYRAYGVVERLDPFVSGLFKDLSSQKRAKIAYLTSIVYARLARSDDAIRWSLISAELEPEDLTYKVHLQELRAHKQ